MVIGMEQAGERRAEQRLRYRWPVRFAGDAKEKPFPGQIVDVSSGGIALLCRGDESCPHLDQPIRASFGVPHFDSEESFDTVLFNRMGRVCRVEDVGRSVRRIAIQFGEPLFFRPGEQGISESDVRQRLKAKVKSIAETRAKVEAEAKARKEAEARAEAEKEAR